MIAAVARRAEDGSFLPAAQYEFAHRSEKPDERAMDAFAAWVLREMTKKERNDQNEKHFL